MPAELTQQERSTMKLIITALENYDIRRSIMLVSIVLLALCQTAKTEKAIEADSESYILTVSKKEAKVCSTS
jgi:hypothetical protein